MTAPTENTFGSTSVPAQFQNQILVSAARWGISPALLAAQLDAESSFNPNAKSLAGAVGIAQFLPETAKSMGVDPWNPLQAIDGMAHLDSIYIKRFGAVDKALAAYNAGPGAVDKYDGIPPYAETQNYVKKIMGKLGEALSNPVANPSLVQVDDKSGDSTPSLTKALATLADPDFWKRIGVGIAGGSVVLVGAYFMMKKAGFDPVKEIESVL